MNKKGKVNIVAVSVVLLVLIAGAGVGYMTDWFGLVPPPPATGGGATPSTLASFKLSVLDSSSVKNRYAGTGYCWQTATPQSLITGGTVTLSASSSTSVSPVNIGDSITCVSFDSTHYGIPKTQTIAKEGDEMILDSKNASSSSFSANTYYLGLVEDNATASAGGSVVIDKVLVTATADYVSFNAKTMCIVASNASPEVKSSSVDGMTPRPSIPYAYRNNATKCFDFASPVMLGGSLPRPTNKQIVGNIQIDFTSSFASSEPLFLVFFDEAYYKNRNGYVSKGIEDDQDTPADVGTGVIVAPFTVQKI